MTTKIFVPLLAIFMIGCAFGQEDYADFYGINDRSGYYIPLEKDAQGREIPRSAHISTISWDSLYIANLRMEKELLAGRDSLPSELRARMVTHPEIRFESDYYLYEEYEGEEAQEFGFRKFTLEYLAPEEEFFSGKGRSFRNISPDGVLTEIDIFLPVRDSEWTESDLMEYVERAEYYPGQVYMSEEEYMFVHRREVLEGAWFYQQTGYRTTLRWEDFGKVAISDYYAAQNEIDGEPTLYFVDVTFSGDKQNLSFEQLEGRRYYLRAFINELISSLQISGVKTD